MAELATIARPYAEALFQVASPAQAAEWGEQLELLGEIAGDPLLRQFAGDPKATPAQVLGVLRSAAGRPLAPQVENLVGAVIDNGRLAALPAVAAQFRVLANGRSGVQDAIVYSAFPIEPAQLADVVASLEQRFGRKLNARVELDPELIGGIRVVVGDEVLDTSVRARLEGMKAALTA